MNIENKTNEEIRAHIIKMSASYKKTGKDLYLKIKADCEAELQRRAEKKTEEQPIEKIEQLPEPAMTGYIPTVERDLKNKVAEQEQSARAFEPKPILTAPQPKALTKLPAPTKPIKWANGDVKEMNELDLRRKSVDYFGDVLNGKRLPSDFYRSMQFNNLVRFQIGLYRFGHPIMAHTALHPTYNMCEKKTQDRSLELFKQVHDMWNQYKDTDIV